jgi:Prp8 binding protein
MKRGRDELALARPAAGAGANGGKRGRGDELVATGEAPARTSSLLAPVVRLTGHGGAVNGVAFSPRGRLLASASTDRRVLLWSLAAGDACENYALLSGHENAVTQVRWARDELHLASSSADRTVRWWDAESGTSVLALRGHRAFVNCCAVSPAQDLCASGADDRSARLWDPREGAGSVGALAHDFEVASCCFLPVGAGGGAGGLLATGSVDGVVRVWDLRSRAALFELNQDGRGGVGVVTGLACGGAAGQRLLSCCSDGTLAEWDARLGTLEPQHERFRREFVLVGGKKPPRNSASLLLRAVVSQGRAQPQWLAAGSGANTLNIWAADSGALEYSLPGHQGAILDVDFSPIEPVVASASLDKTIFLGELT